MKHKHQWIKIKKILGRTEENQKSQDEEYEAHDKRWKERPIIGMMPGLVIYDLAGALIKCAECGEQKEVWETKQ